MKKKILVLEDERNVLEILSFALGREKYQVIKASNVSVGIKSAKKQQPDLTILDLSATAVEGDAGMDSLDACCLLRKEGIVSPILICIDKDGDSKKVFDAGADDYIEKPFTIKDLLFRVNVNTWHIEMQPDIIGANSKRQVVGPITIYPDHGVVTKDDKIITLSLREYDVICFLAKEPGKIVTREELMHEVWGYTNYLGDLHAVDVTMSRLRGKIEDDPANPTIIITKRGRGYMLSVE